MADKDYMALAIEERARRQAAADQSEIDAIANAMREADERYERRLALCAKHGLDPSLPDTPVGHYRNRIADAVISHQHQWREFVTNAHPDKRGGAAFHHSEILSPEGIEDPQRRAVAQTWQAKLRPAFEAHYDRLVAQTAVQSRRAAA